MPRVASRIVSALLATSGLLLVLFHVWLFWHRWHAGGFSDPLVAARWIGSALLVAALFVARRRRLLPRGRQALVVWTLIALVHVGSNHPQIQDSPLSAPAILFVVPSAAGAALLAAAVLTLVIRRRRNTYSGPRLAPQCSSRRQHVRAPLLASPSPLRAPPIGVIA